MAITVIAQHQLPFPLNREVDSLYYVHGTMPYGREKVFPSSTFDLTINLGDAIGGYLEGQSTPTLYRDSWCAGVWTRHHVVEWPPDTHFIGVTFRPGGAYSLLGIPANEFRDQIVPLDAIWRPSEVAGIRERLWETGTPQRRLALFAAILANRRPDRLPSVRIARYALGRLTQNDGLLRIRALCEDIGISHRHLSNLVKQVAGVTPKQLARLSRFGRVLTTLNGAEHFDLTSVAHAVDYFDQSHFCNDFRAFTGESPSDYLRRIRQIRAERPDHARHVRLMASG